MLVSEASAPTTSAPSRAIGSHNSPPPQPMSRNAQALERPRRVRIAAEARRHLVADIGEANRIELVQRAELSVRIPPFRGQGGKAFHFAGIDRRSPVLWLSGFWHDLVS